MNANLLLAVLLLIITMCNSAWSAPLTAYVAEFSVSGAAKPDETKVSIQTLLLSRLSGEKISTQARPEGAEIKVSGSYLLSGSIFSLDAVATSSAGVILARAFAQGKNPDELISAVGTLAKSLSEGIDKGMTSAGAPQVAIIHPDFVKPAKTVSSAGQAIHNMTGALSGLAVGRTFPGGERELFMVGNHTLRYYLQGAELKLMSEIPYKVNEKIIAVDVADLDTNTIPEIYVTVINGEELVSQVWTVDGASLKPIAGPLPYFFRAVTGAGGAKKLYAQKQSGAIDFYGEIAEVVKSGSSFQLSNPVKLPKQAYLYNFNILKGLKGEPNPVMFDQSGYLRIFNSTGDELWKSSEEYSGSETNFKRSEIGSTGSSESGFRQVFLDQRLVIKANGELLVPKNTGSWFLFNKHSYSRNSLYCFVWDGTNLEEKWHTRQSDYYMADFAYDDNSRDLLMLEVVSKEEGVFDKGTSRLVIKRVD